MLVSLPLFAPLALALEPISLDVQVGRPSHGVIVGIVAVPVEQVLDIVMDCDRSDRWFPDLEDTRVVGPGRCAGTTDLPWPISDRVWEIDTFAEGGADRWEARFAYVEGSGNLGSLHGRYVLERLDAGRTRVTYEGWVDLGFWAPQPLVAWATARVLPGILAGIEREARSQTIAMNPSQTGGHDDQVHDRFRSARGM